MKTSYKAVFFGFIGIIFLISYLAVYNWGKNSKKCKEPTPPVVIQIEKNNQKIIDSLKKEILILKNKKHEKVTVIIQNCDSAVDTSHIPAVFRELTDYFN